jgi:diguanylate cyclase
VIRTSNGGESADAPGVAEALQLQLELNAALQLIHELRTPRPAAEMQSDSGRTTLLLAANEQLVVTALQAQTDADSAARALDVIAHAADHDTLTTLPNRQLLLGRFSHAQSAARRGGTKLALLFIDLNGFKSINDTLGHASGDQVLRLVAKRLVSAVRDTDTVSRHGGDEFLILLTEVHRAADVAAVANKIIAVLARPAKVRGHPLTIRASIGISMFPQDGEDAAALIERADLAMYKAKRSDGGRFVFFGDPDYEGTRAKPVHMSRIRHRISRYFLVRVAKSRRGDDQREAGSTTDAPPGPASPPSPDKMKGLHAPFLGLLARELACNQIVSMHRTIGLLQLAKRDEAVFARIEDAVNRQIADLSRLIDDLLLIQRNSTRAPWLEHRTIDLVKVINEAIVICKPAAEARSQRLTLTHRDPAISFRGDSICLIRLFRCLLDNTISHTANACEILITLRATESVITITVPDPAFSDNSTRFSQTPDAMEPWSSAGDFDRSGPAFGLVVAQELVAAHHGTMETTSAGSGSPGEFTLRFPRLSIHPGPAHSQLDDPDISIYSSH